MASKGEMSQPAQTARWSHRPKKAFCCVLAYAFLHLTCPLLREIHSGVAALVMVMYLFNSLE